MQWVLLMSCTTMRSAVILSFSLLSLGILLLLISELTGQAVPTAHAALLLTLGAPLALVVAFLLAIWPGARTRLSECQH